MYRPICRVWGSGKSLSLSLSLSEKNYQRSTVKGLNKGFGLFNDTNTVFVCFLDLLHFLLLVLLSFSFSYTLTQKYKTSLVAKPMWG